MIRTETDPKALRRAHLPRGLRNHNPGNIDRHPGVRWQGQADDQRGDPRFVVFEHPKWGIRAIARILITYQDKRRARDGSKIDTIREIVERWAPATENDTDAYAAHVAKLTDIGADERLDVYEFETMKDLVKAIIVHENGGNPFSDDTVEEGLRLAGIEPPRRPLIRQADVAATAGAGSVALLGLLADTATTELPKAVATAQSIAPIAPTWTKTLLLALILIALGVSLAKQIRDRKAGRR